MSLAKNVFVFIGPPGSGKGSLSHLCVQQFGWTQLSTGNLCRKHIAEQTELGKEIDFAIKSGNLVSDNLITAMVKQWLSEEMDKPEQKTVILDGYPRTAEQAKLLSGLLKDFFKGLKLRIVRLDISDQVLIKRLTSRVVCQNKDCQAVYSIASDSLLKPKHDMTCDLCGTALGRRKDDEVSTIQDRLSIYRRHEQDLLNYFSAIGQPIVHLAVDKTLPMVFEEFKKMITPWMCDLEKNQEMVEVSKI